MIKHQGTKTSSFNADSAGMCEVPTPGEITELLEELTGGALDDGRAGALTQQLQSVQQQLDLGNSAPAIGQLNGFIMLVNALGSTGTLSAEEAQSLIDAANAIINQQGG